MGFSDLEVTVDSGEKLPCRVEARFQWTEEGVEGEKIDNLVKRFE